MQFICEANKADQKFKLVKTELKFLVVLDQRVANVDFYYHNKYITDKRILILDMYTYVTL
jgi:hypothetical protein